MFRFVNFYIKLEKCTVQLVELIMFRKTKLLEIDSISKSFDIGSPKLELHFFHNL